MVKPEWGIKRYCQKCHKKYYDMKHDPITCPSCGTVYQPEFLKSRDDLRASNAKEAIILDDEVEAIAEDFDVEDDEPEITEDDVKGEV